MVLSSEDQELIDRISAMSAEQFNACMAACDDYQVAFNTWLEYQGDVEYDSTNIDPLPDSDDLLDVVDQAVLKQIRKDIRIAIAEAEKSGEEFNEEDIRQEVFLESFRNLVTDDLLSEHAVTEAMYHDFEAMDEEVYHQRLSWSLISGAGKNLAEAAHMSRRG